MSDLNIAIIATVVGGLILSAIIAFLSYAFRNRTILKEKYLIIRHKFFNGKNNKANEDQQSIVEYIERFSKWVSKSSEGTSIEINRAKRLVKYDNIIGISVTKNRLNGQHFLVLTTNEKRRFTLIVDEQEFCRVAKLLYYMEVTR